MPPFPTFQSTFTPAFLSPLLRRRRSCPTSQPSSSVFPYKVHQGYYYSMSSVGVSVPPAHNPPLLPKAKVHQFSPRWTFILFSLPSTDPTVIQTAHPSSHIPSWGFGDHYTHFGGRSLLPDPPHPSFSDHTPTFLSVYISTPNFCTPIIWLATFVSIVFHLEFVCTSFRHTYVPPTLLASHPLGLPFGSFPWRVVGLQTW